MGALMVFRPQYFHHLSLFLNRWVSTRNFDKSLENSYRIDHWFYRYHRQSGAVLLIGALYILYYLVVQLDRAVAERVFSQSANYPPSLLLGLLDAAVLIGLLSSLGAIFIGLFLLLRPSLLRGLENHANQWISMRKALKPLEMQRDMVESIVDRHLRKFGIFFMLGGIYITVIFLIFLPKLCT
ncbi:MAG: hypothetical protein PHP57_03745 [Sideroxydans sp.]|nr:hypothetical protein [Sideroxydans sp.]